MTSYLHNGYIGNKRRENEYRRLLKVTQQGQQDLTPRRLLKLIHQGAGPDQGRSLTSTIAVSNAGWQSVVPVFLNSAVSHSLRQGGKWGRK